MNKPILALLSTVVLGSAVGLGGCGSAGMAGGPDEQDMGTGSMNPDLTPPTPQIKHVVLISQENHTFDTYFGRYCTAPSGSNPTCNTGPSCCERAPSQEASGAGPVTLDDALNASYDPDHTHDCEMNEMNGGKMDRYVTGTSCSDARNFAIATPAVIQPYFDLATKYAMADRYFQPVIGQSSSNDMYYAVARFVFRDNDRIPKAQGHGCWYPLKSTTQYTGQTTIADLLINKGHTFATYGEGYDAMVAATVCPTSIPGDCTSTVTFPGLPTSCTYDSSDYPWQYYAQFADNPLYIKDYTKLAKDVAAGKLPTFSFVKGTSYHTEHPNFGNKISFGVAFVNEVIGTILSSQYAEDTLILVTWDEGGGYYDHIAPPGPNPIDGEAYGTRIPFIAVGKFAKKNFVSHVQMEHSSVVKFLEYNFLDGQTGQLKARDTNVNNIGSLLDPSTTGIFIPET